jgi:competence protein ComEC
MRALSLLLLLPLLAGCPDPQARERVPDSPPAAPAAPAQALAGEGDAGPLEIRFLDVGQGAAVLLRVGDRAALVDAGPANRIVGQLRALGVDSLALLVASHNHADHIGGMDAILDSIPVRFYLDNGHPAATRIQARVLERVEREGVTYLEPTERTLSLGDVRLRIIPAPPVATGEDQNNRSLSVVVERGSFSALLTGDSEVPLLNALLERDLVPEVDVLKAAHHGSRNGVTPAWLARTRPDVVVVSLAADNSYGHPHAAAMRYYCASGRRVYRTDQHGDVSIRVDTAGAYTVEVARREALTEAGEPASCGPVGAGGS